MNINLQPTNIAVGVNNRQERFDTPISKPNLSGKYNNVDGVKAQAAFNVSFHGLWNTTLQDKVDAGVKAVDEHTMFIATDDTEEALFYLNKGIHNIKTPLLDLYVLEDKKIDRGFGIFKNKNGYQYTRLGFFMTSIKNGNQNIDVKSCETHPINNSTTIPKEILDKNPLKINIPKTPDKTGANKYLTHYKMFKDDIAIARLNQSFVNNIFTEKDSRGLKIIKYKDVGGIDGVVRTLQEKVICPLKYPQAFQNIRVNKGLILHGPPRCGKTLVGLATANEVNANFIYINANEMTTANVGGSEENWRNLFADVRAKQPAILFIDEIDSVARKRDGSSSARYQNTVVNQLLGLMSDLEKSNDNVFVIAATNRLDLLDDAMTSTGRFGLHIKVDKPDRKGVEQIYNIHSKGQPIDDDIEKNQICDKMHKHGFNGSDIAEVISNSYHNTLARNNIYDKMLDDTISLEEIKDLKINNEDMLKAVDNLAKQKQESVQKNERPPIKGFTE